jgi:hypothetical protein
VELRQPKKVGWVGWVGGGGGGKVVRRVLAGGLEGALGLQSTHLRAGSRRSATRAGSSRLLCTFSRSTSASAVAARRPAAAAASSAASARASSGSLPSPAASPPSPPASPPPAELLGRWAGAPSMSRSPAAAAASSATCSDSSIFAASAASARACSSARRSLQPGKKAGRGKGVLGERSVRCTQHAGQR